MRAINFTLYPEARFRTSAVASSRYFAARKRRERKTDGFALCPSKLFSLSREIIPRSRRRLPFVVFARSQKAERYFSGEARGIIATHQRCPFERRNRATRREFKFSGRFGGKFCFRKNVQYFLHEVYYFWSDGERKSLWSSARKVFSPACPANNENYDHVCGRLISK